MRSAQDEGPAGRRSFHGCLPKLVPFASRAVLRRDSVADPAQGDASRAPRSGQATAPEAIRLGLLPSGPDPVHRAPPRCLTRPGGTGATV